MWGTSLLGYGFQKTNFSIYLLKRALLRDSFSISRTFMKIWFWAKFSGLLECVWDPPHSTCFGWILVIFLKVWLRWTLVLLIWIQMDMGPTLASSLDFYVLTMHSYLQINPCTLFFWGKLLSGNKHWIKLEGVQLTLSFSFVHWYHCLSYGFLTVWESCGCFFPLWMEKNNDEAMGTTWHNSHPKV